MLLSGQKERPLQLHYISLRADAFLLTVFLSHPLFSLSLCTNNTAAQIDMFLFFPCDDQQVLLHLLLTLDW